MGNEGRGGARGLCLKPDVAPGVVPCVFVGARRTLLSAIAAAAPTGLGGRDGWPGPSEEIVGAFADALAPPSCRNFASMRAIFASVLRRAAEVSDVSGARAIEASRGAGRRGA